MNWEQELHKRLKIDSTHSYIISVSDRFGDYGDVGVVLAEVENNTLVISLFLLSCRVLGKGVEHHVVANIARINEKLKIKKIEKFHSL